MSNAGRIPDESAIRAFIERLYRALSPGKFRREPDAVFVEQVVRWVRQHEVSREELDRVFALSVAERKFVPTVAELTELLPRARIARPPAAAEPEPELSEEERRKNFELLHQIMAGKFPGKGVDDES